MIDPQTNSDSVNQAAPREPISAFVICFNEQEHIEKCLKSLMFCDEIVVIDSFSTDQTVEIAKRLGAKIIQRPWPGYREQKAFGLGVVSNEWVVNIDADERVSDELRENIIRVLTEERAGVKERKRVAGYYVNRVVFYLGRWWRKGGWYPEYRLRVFRRDSVKWGGIEPHEKAIVTGESAILPGELYHFTYKNMDEQFSRLHSLSTIAAREEYEAGRRANFPSLFINPILRMLKFYILKKGYREGMAGLVVSGIEGYYTYMKYAKLWERGYLEKLEGKKDSSVG